MSVRKNSFLLKLFAMLLIAATVPAIVWGQHNHDHDVDVEVVNTPNVKVVNTPSVNVSNLPAVQLAPGTAVTVSGTPTVQVGNAVQLAPGTAVALSGVPTVQVGNTVANPVPVHDAAVPKRTPFQTLMYFDIQKGDTQGSKSFTVPNGKRLVIEYVSNFSFFFNVSPLLEIVTEDSAGNALPHYLPVLQQRDFGGGLFEYIAGQEVKLYSEPATTVTCFAQASPVDPNSNIGSVRFAISGYLEDVQ